MTGKQQEAAKNALKMKYGSNDNWSDEDADLEAELDCRSMIDSILCYDGVYGVKKGGYKYNEYLKPFTKPGASLHDGSITESRLDELIAEQIDSMSRARIEDAGTDSEGLGYKRIVWEDD